MSILPFIDSTLDFTLFRPMPFPAAFSHFPAHGFWFFISSKDIF
jgi:hypothetical protein